MSYSQQYHTGQQRWQRMKTKGMIRIAVYGTLRQGFANHERYLSDHREARYIGPDQLVGVKLYLLGGGVVPVAVTTGDEDDKAAVEVYDVTPDLLEHIDLLEGVIDGVGYGAYVPVQMTTRSGLDVRAYMGSKDAWDEPMRPVYRNDYLSHARSEIRDGT